MQAAWEQAAAWAGVSRRRRGQAAAWAGAYGRTKWDHGSRPWPPVPLRIYHPVGVKLLAAWKPAGAWAGGQKAAGAGGSVVRRWPGQAGAGGGVGRRRHREQAAAWAGTYGRIK